MIKDHLNNCHKRYREKISLYIKKKREHIYKIKERYSIYKGKDKVNLLNFIFYQAIKNRNWI